MNSPATFHLRVLLVDDDPSVGPLLRTLLESRSHSVTLVATAKDALHEFSSKHEQFDVVVLDQNLPDMLGSEVATLLRTDWQHFPLVLSTGDRESVVNTTSFDCVLEKPFCGRELECAMIRAFAAHAVVA